TPEQVRDALPKLASAAPRPLVEVSGGIDESSIAAYAQPGVDILSVGSLTHSVRSVDLSLLVT
ncbi:MAG TPA: nicotinate-nucleotide diphosphorylase (carboxylating), partial [Bdellovibrionota bacterium]|nr:nicotinate-nucleotide diphosphorylase (carboxylating) [Bdellovibrionota bacterium]